MKRMKIDIHDAYALVAWFDKNKRELPWRDTGNPYDVWLSEVMLQQTRIEAVREKYILFERTLPDLKSLAEADDDVLLRLWEGLGYYNRARNLKRCAQVIVNQYDGAMPSSYEELLSLPGFGPYTAGAVASIAFGKAVPAVDGNVMRVLSRVFENREDVRKSETKKMYENIIRTLFEENDDPHFVSSFNQGLMELGEVICVPNGRALCDQCPFSSVCLTHKHGTYEEVPFKSALKQRKQISKTVIVIRNGDRFLIHKRKNTGLLAGMYEFMNVDKFMTQKEVIAYVNEKGMEALHVKKLPDSRHLFAHLEWNMKGYEVTVSQCYGTLPENCTFVNEMELNQMAIPSAFHTYVDYYMLRKKDDSK